MDPDPLLANWRFLLGLSVVLGGLIGSFLNVVAYRLPAGRSVVHPPSACPRCGSRIRPWHNLPVVGWLMLRGKCKDCGLPIAPRYPLVEAATGLLWGGLYLSMIPDVEALLDPLRLVSFAVYGAYFSALLGACLIDADHFILPDVITLPLIPLGITAVALLDGFGLDGVDVRSSVLGAAVGGGGMLLIAVLGRIAFGREAMGLGDVKLVAAVGAWQGLHPTLLITIFGASVLGSVVGITTIALRGRDRPSRLPFGPYLAAGAVISWIAGDAIVRLWLPSFA